MRAQTMRSAPSQLAAAPVAQVDRTYGNLAPSYVVVVVSLGRYIANSTWLAQGTRQVL